MEWKREIPSVADLNGEAEEYFLVRGGNFNRTVMVRANNGVTSSVVDGKRAFRAEVNFTVVAENYPAHIWAGDLLRYPGANKWEWAGPVPRPAPNFVLGRQFCRITSGCWITCSASDCLEAGTNRKEK